MNVIGRMMIQSNSRHLTKVLTGLFFFFGASLLNAHAVGYDIDARFSEARIRFYQSIEDKSQIDATRKLFQQIIASDSEYAGRAQTYLGALIALKAKHTFWPHQKFKLAKRGLAVMDQGIAQSPNDVEALFIHGATCFHLPFFFKRGDDAQRDFKRILKLLPTQIDAYEPELIHHVIAFISENGELDAQLQESVRRIRTRLTLTRK